MISTEALLEQVVSAVPFLWDDFEPSSREGFISILRSPESHSYFELTLAAHFATVGSFVPTDVDLWIREKAWAKVHHQSEWESLWKATLNFGQWDESRVSRRWVANAAGNKLSGHQGEFLTVLVGAYMSAKRIQSSNLGEVREVIEQSVQQQVAFLDEQIDGYLKDRSVPNLKPLISGIASIVHNLGDLDRGISRGIEQNRLDQNDVLLRRVFRLAHGDGRTVNPLLVQVGKIYQEKLAEENHRHFALRKPKCLRKSARFLLPYGPCLDDWGRQLATEGKGTGLLNEGEIREILEALIDGWIRLNPRSIYTSVGYARVLAGFVSALPNGLRDLEPLLSPLLAKKVLEGGIRTHLNVRQNDFERSLMKIIEF